MKNLKWVLVVGIGLCIGACNSETKNVSTEDSTVVIPEKDNTRMMDTGMYQRTDTASYERMPQKIDSIQPR